MIGHGELATTLVPPVDEGLADDSQTFILLYGKASAPSPMRCLSLWLGKIKDLHELASKVHIRLSTSNVDQQLGVFFRTNFRFASLRASTLWVQLWLWVVNFGEFLVHLCGCSQSLVNIFAFALLMSRSFYICEEISILLLQRFKLG